MSNPYTHNPFGVMQVARDFERKALDRAADRLAMERRLAGEEEGVHEIRAAAQALRNPVARFEHEMFWPLLTEAERGAWPDDLPLAEFPQCANIRYAKAYEKIAPDDDERADHNRAVFLHAAALAARDDAKLWARAFEAWRDVLDADGFWAALRARVKALDDPQLRTDAVSAMRRELPGKLLAPAAALASAHLLAGRVADAGKLLGHIGASGLRDAAVNEARESAVRPVVQRLEAACAAAEKTTSALDERAAKKEEVKADVEAAWPKMRDAIATPLDAILALGDAAPVSTNALRDRAAEIFRSFAGTAYVHGHLQEVAAEALERGVAAAASKSTLARVEKELAALGKAKEINACAYCGAPGGRDDPHEVELHRITGTEKEQPRTRFGALGIPELAPLTPSTSVTVNWHTVTLQVPRCQACADVHANKGSKTHVHRDHAPRRTFGCITGVLGAVGLAFLIYRTRALEGDDWVAVVAGCLFVTLLATCVFGWFGALFRDKRRKTLPLEQWRTWGPAATYLAQGYQLNSRPSQEQMRAYVDGAKWTYSDNRKDVWCTKCKTKLRNAHTTCECGNKDVTVVDPAKAEERFATVRGSMAAVGAMVFFLVFLAAYRPTRDELAWQVAKAVNTQAMYERYVRWNEGGIHWVEAAEALDQKLWDYAMTGDDPYWFYLRNSYGNEQRVLEALRALDAERPWSGKHLLSSLDNARGRLPQTPLIDRWIWERVAADGSTEALARYLQVMPRGSHREDAERMLDDRAWADAKAKNTVAAYALYLARKKRAHAKEAEAALTDLPWQAAVQRNTEAAYRQFLKRHPRHARAEDARRRIDEVAWKRAVKTNTEQGYAEYVSQNPAGSFRKEAAERVVRLGRERREREEQLRRRADDDNWRNALFADNEHAYNRYLRDTKGAYAEQARARLRELPWERALKAHSAKGYARFAQQHSTSPFAHEARRQAQLLTAKRPQPSAFELGKNAAVKITVPRGGFHRRGTKPDPFGRSLTHVRLKAFWSPTAPVVGVSIGTHARAYPIDWLVVHRVVNDVMGGVPFALHLDPDTGTVACFERRARGRILRFATSNVSYRKANLLYDRETESFWCTPYGVAVVGPLAGAALKWMPVEVTTWAAWHKAHPHARCADRNWGTSRAEYATSLSLWNNRFGAAARARKPEHEPCEVVRVGDIVHGYRHDALAEGDTTDGELVIRKAGRTVQVLQKDKRLPSIRITRATWDAFYKDFPLFPR